MEVAEKPQNKQGFGQFHGGAEKQPGSPRHLPKIQGEAPEGYIVGIPGPETDEPPPPAPISVVCPRENLPLEVSITLQSLPLL